MSSKTKRTHKEAKIETKNLAPVQDAVREYRVIEDGAYAYHLQEREIENHYAQNVNMRRIVQEDIRTAKQLQDEEDRRAKIMTLDEEQEAKQMDEELAEIIQEEIFIKSAQEEQEKKEREERDKELALLMEEKERRRQVEIARHENRDHRLAEKMQNMKVTPPSSRDEQRMRLMTDEELAKRLQEEEKLKVERTKRRQKEMKSVVEMQDEELAKYIHERDVEAAEMKYRKERERRNKSKKKGKWDDEPLYYDDNLNPPSYNETPPKVHPDEHRRQHPNEHRHQETHPKSHPDEHRRQHPNGHRHQETRPKSHPDDRRQEPNDRDPPPEYRLQEDSRRRYHDEQQHRKDDRRRPERPPPPKFDESHNTEVKVPLDDSQRKSNGSRHSSRPSRGQEYSRDYEKSSSHHHHNSRGSSERNRSSRGSADDLDRIDQHRSSSERQRPRIEHERHHGSSRSHPHNGHHRERRDDHAHDQHRGSKPHHQDPWERQNNSRPTSQWGSRPQPKPRSNVKHSSSTPELDQGIENDAEIQYSENFAKLTEEELWNQNNNMAHKGSRKKKSGDCKQQ